MRTGLGSGNKLTVDEKYTRCFLIFLSLLTFDCRIKIINSRARVCSKPNEDIVNGLNEGIHETEDDGYYDSFDDGDDDEINLEDKDKEQDQEINQVSDVICEEEYDRWLTLFQRTLIFYQWINSPTHPVSHFVGGHNSLAARRCRSYMQLYKDTANRSEGMGLKIVKFHHLSHWWWYIIRFGSMCNMDGGRPESNQKSMIKNPAKITQGRHESVNSQTCERYSELKDLDIASRFTNRRNMDVYDEVSDLEEQDNRYSVGGSRFLMVFFL